MRRMEFQAYSKLVHRIYDCALNPELWRSLLPLLADEFEADSSTFAIHDMQNGARQRFYDFGISETAVQSYFATYGSINPTLEAKSVFIVGQPYTRRMIISDEEYFESRFYREWAKPNRQGDIMGGTVHRNGSLIATHAVAREDNRGYFTDVDLERYRLIVPHISRALAISEALELRAIKANSLMASLDSLRAAVFLLDPRGIVIHANLAGKEEVERSDTLNILSDRLVATEPAAATVLQAAIAQCAADSLDPRTGNLSIPLKGTSGRRCIANVIRLDQGERQFAGHPSDASLAVFVQDLASPHLFPGEAIAKLYNLTAAEIRVALALAAGHDIQEIALTLGISVPTVKTHLARLFSKTGTNRQATLVALIHKASLP